MIFPSLGQKNNLAVNDTLVLQTVLFLLSSLILDGGQCLQFVGFASLVWWLVFLRILIVRPRTEDRWDRIFLKLGFPILLALIVAAFPIWGWLRLLLQ